MNENRNNIPDLTYWSPEPGRVALRYGDGVNDYGPPIWTGTEAEALEIAAGIVLSIADDHETFTAITELAAEAGS